MHETYDQEFRREGPPRQYPVRLGIIGGGQLARMTAIAALPLGVDVVVLEKNPDSPAARLSPDCVIGDWTDGNTLLEFARRCDVITLENEFVDAAALGILERAGHRVFPGAECIAVTQDKFAQKSALKRLGIAMPGFCAVASPAEIAAAADRFGWPVVLKTRRNGYDGKGNRTLDSASDLESAWQALGGGSNALMVEAFFPFEKELAVIVTRGRDGATVVYPVVETVQRNHICHAVKAPAPISRELADRAGALAKQAIEAVGGVGTFGVEMFLSANGEIAVNEIAPRVHNSGHYTIEACICSQFENHVRAVLGWPLGDPSMVAPAAVMVNLLGTEKTSGRPRGLDKALRMTGARVHLYGKLMSGPGRKMGHITALGNSMQEAHAAAERARNELCFGEDT